MIYLTSDWHLTHENIMKYVGRFGNKAYDYSSKIIEYAKSVLKKNDILIYMGDLDCGPNKNVENLKNIMDLLPSKKIFIRGNHDKWLDDKSIHYIGFSKICDLIKHNDILICHYPLDKKSTLPPEAPKFFKKIDLNGIKTIYHGHTHNNFKVDNSDGIVRINCCIDRDPSKINPFIELYI